MQTNQNTVMSKHKRLRTWGIAAVVAAVGVTAACGAANDKGASKNGYSGEGINNNGVPTVPGAQNTAPKECGREATAAAWPGTLPGPSDAVPSGGTLDKIRKRGFLIAGIDLNTELFGYDPHHTNQPEGFDVDIAKAMARAVFGTDGKIQFRVVTLGDGDTSEYNQLHNGNVDLVVRTTTITCARMQGQTPMSFSNPYYTAQQKLLMPLGDDGKPQALALEDMKGKKVCATKNSTAIDTIKAKAGPDAAVEVPNGLDCLMLLQQDQIDAIFTDDALLRGMQAQDPHVAITTAPAVQKQPYGIVTANDGKPNDLTPFVNSALAKLIADPGPNGWATLFANDLKTGPEGPPEIPAKYPLG